MYYIGRSVYSVSIKSPLLHVCWFRYDCDNINLDAKLETKTYGYAISCYIVWPAVSQTCMIPYVVFGGGLHKAIWQVFLFQRQDYH